MLTCSFLEMERIETQTKEVEEKFKIADTQLKEDNEAYENIKAEYEKKKSRTWKKWMRKSQKSAKNSAIPMS